MSEPKRYDDVIGMLTDQCHQYAVENTRLKAEVERLSKPAIIGGYNLSQYIRMANSETLEFDNGDIFADMTLPERIKYIVESHSSLRSVAEDNKRECEATRIENARLKAEVERSRDQYNGIIDTQLAVIERLKAEVERLEANTTKLCTHGDAEIARLKAEVERLELEVFAFDRTIKQASCHYDNRLEDIRQLQAQVERLTMAGDAMAKVITEFRCGPYGNRVKNAFVVWNAWNAAKEGKQP